MSLTGVSSSNNNSISNNGCIINEDVDELFVFGYACKVYRDDERALQTEKALIPWMGDEQNSVDRYDGRGHLSSLTEFEATSGAWEKYWASLGPEELAEEQMVEEERWLSLNHEEEETRDEILKRAAAPAENFAEIGFNYDDANEEKQEIGDPISVQNRPTDFVDPDDKPYKLPKGLTLPVTVPRPDTRREHTIIEKTAEFIARQGGQLEVVIKMKQKNNAQFAFLDIEHKLNLYYRYLVQQIRSGAYRPSLHDNDSDSESDDDSEGAYLHPSLFASKNSSTSTSSGPPEALKNIFKAQASKSKSNCAYSQLIDKLRPSLEIDQEASNGPSGENSCSAEDSTSNGTHDFTSSRQENPPVEFESLVAIMPPPPDVQPIVDKMAEYVAKNGADFEESIRAKGDPKFSFVDSGNEFYKYYQFKVREFKMHLSTTTVTTTATTSTTTTTATAASTTTEIATEETTTTTTSTTSSTAKTSTPSTENDGLKTRRSPNALERIALENSLHTSPERTPKEKRTKKQRLKINIKTQDVSGDHEASAAAAAAATTATFSETINSTETTSSMIGPRLPSLYDDEDVEVREDVLEDLAVPKTRISSSVERVANSSSRKADIVTTKDRQKETSRTKRRSRSHERAKHATSREKIRDDQKGHHQHHHHHHRRDRRSRSREKSRRSRSRDRIREKESRDRKRRHDDDLSPPTPMLPAEVNDGEESTEMFAAESVTRIETTEELKRKQLERKRRLAAFLSKVKEGGDAISNENANSDTSTTAGFSRGEDLKAKLRHLKKTMADSDEECILVGEADSRTLGNADKSDSVSDLPSISLKKNHDEQPVVSEPIVKHAKMDLKKLRQDTRQDEESLVDGRHRYDSDEDLYERRRRKSRDRKRRRSSSESSSSSRSRESTKSRKKHHKHHKSKLSRRHRD